MEPTERAVFAQAKRAYELGRARRSALRSLAVVPMFALAQLSPHPSSRLWIGAAALLVSIFILSMRGRSAGRAVPIAILAGLIPLTLPIAVRAVGNACDSALCMSFCLPACVVSGAIAGAALGVRSRWEEGVSARREFIFAALLISGLAGALGCSVAGAGGVLGMLAAELLLSSPAWVAAN